MSDVFMHDDFGEPILREERTFFTTREVFAGWWSIKRSPKPFSVALRHELGVRLYTGNLWIWISGSAPESYPLSGRKPHASEAGPVLIQQTPTTIYCHFEADKPIFMRFVEGTGSYEMIDSAWLGVLVRCAG